MRKNKKEIIEYSKSAQAFDYVGDITIKLTEGDRVYSTKHYHNNGAVKLFNFFADCLIGNFNVAKSSRPCKIVLFKVKEDDSELDPETGEVDPTKAIWDDDTRISTKVFYDSAVTPGASEESGSTVTYHFRIPYLSLVDGERVRKLALYPDIISSYRDDRCAYYILPAAEEIQIPGPAGVSSNFTIIIDWKLHIYNAPKKANN